MKHEKWTTINVSKDVHAQIKDLADQEFRTMNAIVALAVRDYAKARGDVEKE